MSVTQAQRGDGWSDATTLVPTLPFTVRTVVGMGALALGANLVGAIVVALLIMAVNASATHHQLVVLLQVSTGLLGASLVVGAVLGGLVQRRALRWLLSGGVPTMADTRNVVRLPLNMGFLTAAIWAVDGLIIGSVAGAAGADSSTVLGVGAGIALAGLTSSGITYLLVARASQPVTKIALTAHPPQRTLFFNVRAGLLINWLLTSGIPLLGILMILTAPPSRSHIRSASIISACIALAVGFFATSLTARAIGRPMRIIADALHRIGAGDLDVTVPVENPGEIGLLQSGINDMVAGLRERERIEDLFGRHVGPAVAQQALRSGITLSGEHRDVVALFVDITGSTALTRRIEPTKFVGLLNRFFEIVVEEIERNGGLVNKFEGDAALCVFGAPVELADPASAALRAARCIRDRVRDMAAFDVGIGVAAGPVVAGQIGSPSRLEYTVIGDAVNEAARLTDLAKGLPQSLAASAPVLELADDEERAYWMAAGDVILRGRDVATSLYTA